MLTLQTEVQPLHRIQSPSSFFKFDPITPDNGFRMAGYWVWCPSVIRGPDGTWHMFASRWPQWLPFHPGWMVQSEVVHAISSLPEGPYTFAEVVFPARGAEFWDGCSTHNPTVHFDPTRGRYYLFYTGITHPLPPVRPGEPFSCDDPRCIVSRSMKRIGVAWADSLEGPWHRSGIPLLPTCPGTFYSFLTSNPAPWLDEDGSVTLLFKSRAYVGDTHGSMHIGLARAAAPEGPYRVVSREPLFGAARFSEIEDPFLWREAGRLRIIAKDMTGLLCGQEGAGLLAWSDDALHWNLDEPPTAYYRQIHRNDGTVISGSMERPFLLLQDGKATHLCLAVSDGDAAPVNATETWNVVIPLTA